MPWPLRIARLDPTTRCTGRDRRTHAPGANTMEHLQVSEFLSFSYPPRAWIARSLW